MPPNIKIFWESSNPLSNFYLCRIKIYGKLFRSAEHAYVWCKLRFAGNPELTEQIRHYRTAKQVKMVSTKIPRDRLKGWDSVKYQVMEEILTAKVSSCYKFKKSLLDSGSMTLIEGTMDTWWGIGQSAYYTETTHPDYLPGLNNLGNLLMNLRLEVWDLQHLPTAPHETEGVIQHVTPRHIIFDDNVSTTSATDHGVTQPAQPCTSETSPPAVPRHIGHDDNTSTPIVTNNVADYFTVALPNHHDPSERSATPCASLADLNTVLTDRSTVALPPPPGFIQASTSISNISEIVSTTISPLIHVRTVSVHNISDTSSYINSDTSTNQSAYDTNVPDCDLEIPSTETIESDHTISESSSDSTSDTTPAATSVPDPPTCVSPSVSTSHDDCDVMIESDTNKSTSLITNVVRRSLDENRVHISGHSRSFADELKYIGHTKPIDSHKKQKHNVKKRKESTPVETGPMDSYLMGKFRAMKRRISPGKELDTQMENDQKRNRDTSPDK